MTTQIKEALIFQGITFRIREQPLEQYLSKLTEKPELVAHYSLCWRGYFGKWELKGEKLFLTELKATGKGYIEKDIEYIFPGEREVFAEWYTGNICIPDYEVTESSDDIFFDSVTHKKVFLEFKNGVLLNTHFENIFSAEETENFENISIQIEEVLVYENKNYEISADPLAQYFHKMPQKPNLTARYTKCLRGYFGKWELRGKKIFLIKLKATINEDTIKGIEYIFPGKKEVFAEWFNGEICIPNYEIRIPIDDMIVGVNYKNLFLEFKNGILVNSRMEDIIRKQYEEKNYDGLPF